MSSWVNYLPDHPFPIENLPYGAFVTRERSTPHLCSVIGDTIIDLAALSLRGVFDSDVAAALQKPQLNDFLALGNDKWSKVRSTLTSLLRPSEGFLRDDTCRSLILVPESSAQMVLPLTVGDYTDFYASMEHATNMGKMFRPGQPALLENWRYIPVGYHGRASSIVVSGTDVRRPRGQLRPNPEQPPVYDVCKGMDFELEMAAIIGGSNNLGEPIPISQAKKHIFGLALFNDWTARDIQKWEYVPLGPFLGKNFASTLGSWIVTSEALEPFLQRGPTQEPAPLSYLDQGAEPGNYNIELSVSLTTNTNESKVISETNFKHMYWSFAQMIAHHTVNGCNLRPGDVLGSGTISGTEQGTFGSMIELSWQGTKPIDFPSGAQRRMLQDGDTVSFNGSCQGAGYRIGFGECSGKLLPAL